MKLRQFFRPGIFSVILLSLFLFSCSQPGKNNSGVKLIPDLKQKKKDRVNAEYRALCYSGFREGQHPDRGEGANNPSYEELLEDLEILSHDNNFSLIRLYDSGENSKMVLQVIRENKLRIKVMLGIWLRAEISNHEGCPWLTEPIPDIILAENALLNQQEISRAIQLAKEYGDIIVAVNVGNEALVEWNDHKVREETVISYVRRIKSEITQPVTVAENYKWWAESGAKLAGELDFISVHVYPVWEEKDIEEGMSYTIENLLEVREALPGSVIAIGEAGWATTASEFGERASEEKQKKYYNQIMEFGRKHNITIFFFEAFDEPWKGDPNNPLGAEKHWGIFTVDRKPKLVMQDRYSHLQ